MLQKYTFIFNIFLSQKLCIYLFNEKNILSNFLSVWVFLQTFTIHRIAGQGESQLCNSSLPLPPASQALRH